MEKSTLIAQSLRLHLEDRDAAGKLIAAGTEVIVTPSIGYRLADGRMWYPTDRQFCRLSEERGHVMGHTAINYIEKQSLQHCVSFPVNIQKEYARSLQREIGTLTKSERYESYGIGSMVAWLPMRISHSTEAMIVLERDIMLYASHLKLQPISFHKLGGVVTKMDGGVNDIKLEHYYKGKRTETSQVAIKGKFRLFGFDFNSVEEAYRELTMFLETESVKVDRRIVIPQLKDYNETCVKRELLLALTEIGKARSETIRVPKIVEKHYPVPPIDIPHVIPPLGDIPPVITVPPC